MRMCLVMSELPAGRPRPQGAATALFDPEIFSRAPAWLQTAHAQPAWAAGRRSGERRRPTTVSHGHDPGDDLTAHIDLARHPRRSGVRRHQNGRSGFSRSAMRQSARSLGTMEPPRSARKGRLSGRRLRRSDRRWTTNRPKLASGAGRLACAQPPVPGLFRPVRSQYAFLSPRTKCIVLNIILISSNKLQESMYIRS